MIESEIMRDRLHHGRGELLRAGTVSMSCRLHSSALHPHAQRIAVLLNIDSAVTNRAHKSVAGVFPMKDLTGIKRHRQIEFGCRNFCELHTVDRVVLNVMSVQAPKAQLS